MSELMQAPLQAGGEWLLFLLFIVFSVVSALLERRKRKKQAEENPQGSSASAGPLAEEKEEEETGSWPFPMGEDPFDLPKPKQRPEKRPAYERAEEEETAPAAASDPRRTLIEQMEDEAAEAKRLQEAEAVDVYGARAAERQAQEVQPRRRVQELVQERVELDQRQRRKKKKRPKWLLTPKTARDALVFTEILGRPKSEREEEDFG